MTQTARAAARMRFNFRRLPPVSQAALWMAMGGVVGGLMNVVIRLCAEEAHPLEIVFFRNLFGLVVMLPWLRQIGFRSLRSSKSVFFMLRAFVAFVSMVTWFIGITIVPLATATALNFTAPLFATIGAALILGENVRARRWTAIGLGFVGVIVILRPFRPIDTTMLWILVSAATAAMGSITVKFLARTENATSIVGYMVLFTTPMSLIPALFVWSWPSPLLWLGLVLLGIMGSLSHFTVARALGAADQSVVATFEFLRLPYSALLAWLFFGEPTDMWTWIGAAIIACSSLYVAHREAKLARHAPDRVSGGRPVATPLH
jgi:drug/metabolite transporter (DMT)-like permease